MELLAINKRYKRIIIILKRETETAIMIVELLLTMAAFVGYSYWQYQIKSKYWTKIGIKQPTSNPFPLGNNPITCILAINRTKNVGDLQTEQYNQFPDEKVYGTYVLPICKPILMVKDPEIIRDIMVKDFNHFVDRNGLYLFGRDGPTKTDHAWQKQLTNSKGKYWKQTRTTFTPIFTSGKLKLMTQFINIVSQEAVKRVDKAAKDNEDLELKKLFGALSMDTMASCAFGIEAGAFNAEEGTESEFVKAARNIFHLYVLLNSILIH